jgi:hypothetical protein
MAQRGLSQLLVLCFDFTGVISDRVQVKALLVPDHNAYVREGCPGLAGVTA